MIAPDEFSYPSRRRNIKEQEKMIRKIFENLIKLDHPNIVKFHKYWTEMAEANMEKPRVVRSPRCMCTLNKSTFIAFDDHKNCCLPQSRCTGAGGNPSKMDGIFFISFEESFLDLYLR